MVLHPQMHLPIHKAYKQIPVNWSYQPTLSKFPTRSCKTTYIQFIMYLGCCKLIFFHNTLFTPSEPWLLGNIITFLEKVSNPITLCPDSALRCFSQTLIWPLCSYLCLLNRSHLLLPPSLHSCSCCILTLDTVPVRGLAGDRWCTHRVNWKYFNVGMICRCGQGNGSPQRLVLRN